LLNLLLAIELTLNALVFTQQPVVPYIRVAHLISRSRTALLVWSLFSASSKMAD
jgi:hypothetical protein